MSFPPVPPEIRSIAHLMKLAADHDDRNIIVSYWARFYACQLALKLIPGKKPPEVSDFIIAVMDWLENTKKNNMDKDGIVNETVASSIIEEYALQMFNFADELDKKEDFSKNMIKSFYTAGILMDILDQFGEVSDDLATKRKYAKWKAAYTHTCLKAGDPPTSGGPNDHLKFVEDIPKEAKDIEMKQISKTATNNNVNAEIIQEVQKLCRFATSALNYEDVDTAVKYLKEALEKLNPSHS